MAIVIDAPRVKNCGDCIGYYRCKGWTDEPFTCPIKGEIPDKHGRLIDADFLKKYAVRVSNEEGKEYIPADYIDIVPTIVEAST